MITADLGGCAWFFWIPGAQEINKKRAAKRRRSASRKRQRQRQQHRQGGQSLFHLHGVFGRARPRSMANSRKMPGRSPWLGFVLVASLLLVVDAKRARQPRCPPSCTCTKDNALCESAGMIPRSFPPDVTSL